ncbi:unnamed protein product [Vitrella brassicaformis CCMP3155]|uniref:Alpha-1,3-glucosyltransferase n=4 Tax=Vitrella brassicaformis TaxID=1169539 RepID=A0A0G4GXE4_VITBC|nr:unnamed protein product [Vitrella brassicaformis CCMP3155]|eukprot:CEM35747.1 unnamed protein product [Vitrella brassicaformis CCMP3155]
MESQPRRRSATASQQSDDAASTAPSAQQDRHQQHHPADDKSAREQIFRLRIERELSLLEQQLDEGVTITSAQVDSGCHIYLSFSGKFFLRELRGADPPQEAVFVIDVSRQYPFLPPLIACQSFAWPFYNQTPEQLTRDVLQEAWTPLITLSEMVNRLSALVYRSVQNDRLMDDKNVHQQGDGNSGAAVVASLLGFVERHRLRVTGVGVVVLLAVLCRLAVGVYPCSGWGVPPMHGDYEAQRHWMEITTNLPIRDWYVESDANDLQYWGLDYPPLTAYHMYTCGLASAAYEPQSVELLTSRGYETPTHKLFMRMTVLLADVLVFFTAAIYYALCAMQCQGFSWRMRVSTLCLLLLCPAFILIDHGHFQYNCVALGLTLWAVGLIATKRYLIAASAFTLALLYKQTLLYYAPAFFFTLLGLSTRTVAVDKGIRRRLRFVRPLTAVVNVAKIGLVVVLTALVVLMPFLLAGEEEVPGNSLVERLLASLRMSSLIPILRRVFPFNRGLYEDYAATVWVALSPIVKLKRLAAMDNGVHLQWAVGVAAWMTAVGFLPSCWDVMRRPTAKRFEVCLFNCSMSFFLFSWQVHEKAILLPALPACLLLPQYGASCVVLLLAASYSLLPLMLKDQLLPSFVILTVAWVALAVATIQATSRGHLSLSCLADPSQWRHLGAFLSAHARLLMHDSSEISNLSGPHGRRARAQDRELVARRMAERCRIRDDRTAAWSALAGCGFGWTAVLVCVCGVLAGLFCLHMVVPAPERFPFLHEYLNSVVCCGVFVASLMLGTFYQYQLPEFDALMSISEGATDERAKEREREREMGGVGERSTTTTHSTGTSRGRDKNT